MELNFTTFVLEIINFLVLIWVLKRLFYAPIKKAIESRRLDIKKSLDEAASAKAGAESLRQQVDQHLKDWSQERDTKLDELKREMEPERERLLKELHAEMAKERNRLKAQDLATQEEIKSKQEQEAISQSLAFLSKLLASFASPEVERAVLRSFLEKMKTHGSKHTDAISASVFVVHSAFPLEEKERKEISLSLAQFAGGTPAVSFGLDPTLLAGLEITDGAMVLRANLRDELSLFGRVVSHG